MALHPLLLDSFFSDADPVSRFFAYYWLPILIVVVLVVIATRFARKR